MLSTRKISVVILSITLAMFAAGCKKKVPPPPPPPPPAPVKPVEPPPPPRPASIGEFVAEPASIERGQSATLRWNVSNATDITIDQGIGSVMARGTRQVFPSASTTYTLTAKGQSGDPVSATASVNVAVPAPSLPARVERTKSLTDRISSDVQDALFDYDSSDIRADARANLAKNADALKSIFTEFPNASIVVEGHCDERGSAEYNLGLGDRRATAAKDYLTQLGVPADRLRTISYGKERPQCTDSDESCWQRNRRAHFAPAQ